MFTEISLQYYLYKNINTHKFFLKINELLGTNIISCIKYNWTSARLHALI